MKRVITNNDLSLIQDQKLKTGEYVIVMDITRKFWESNDVYSPHHSEHTGTPDHNINTFIMIDEWGRRDWMIKFGYDVMAKATSAHRIFWPFSVFESYENNLTFAKQDFYLEYLWWSLLV